MNDLKETEKTNYETFDLMGEIEERDEVAERLREAADEMEALRAVGRFAAEKRDKYASELAVERRRVVELEQELTVEKEANVGLKNLADALNSELGLVRKQSDERRRAVERRVDELLETRRQRDDFERLAREARRENWFWRVVGFVAGAVSVGAFWGF